MKKILALSLIFVLAMGLVACSGSKLQDGTYTAETSAAVTEAEHGWKDTLVVTVTDGVVTEAVMESFNAEGDKKSEATSETYPMDPLPSEWLPTISANVASAETPDGIDSVAGATKTVDAAKKLYAAILEAAKDGTTETIVVD